ncbi:MAG TPA: hypothetical protein VIU61_10280 [Kofleriaceae bacterium]
MTTKPQTQSSRLERKLAELERQLDLYRRIAAQLQARLATR